MPSNNTPNLRCMLPDCNGLKTSMLAGEEPGWTHPSSIGPLCQTELERRQGLAKAAYARFQAAMHNKGNSCVEECLIRYYTLNLGIDMGGRRIGGEHGEYGLHTRARLSTQYLPCIESHFQAHIYNWQLSSMFSLIRVQNVQTFHGCAFFLVAHSLSHVLCFQTAAKLSYAVRHALSHVVTVKYKLVCC